MEEATDTIPALIKKYLDEKVWECDAEGKNGKPMKGLLYMALPDVLEKDIADTEKRAELALWELADKLRNDDIAALRLQDGSLEKNKDIVFVPTENKEALNARRELVAAREDWEDSTSMRQFIIEEFLPTLKALESGAQPTLRHLRIIERAQEDLPMAIGMLAQGQAHENTDIMTEYFLKKLNDMAREQCQMQKTPGVTPHLRAPSRQPKGRE